MPKLSDQEPAFNDLADFRSTHHSAAAFDAPSDTGDGRSSLCVCRREDVRYPIACSLLAVVAVMVAHAADKRMCLPVRLVRGLFRHKARPTVLTAR